MGLGHVLSADITHLRFTRSHELGALGDVERAAEQQVIPRSTAP